MRPGERRPVLLLENHRLPLWGQMSIQTHSRSEGQGQEAVAALNSVYTLPQLRAGRFHINRLQD